MRVVSPGAVQRTPGVALTGPSASKVVSPEFLQRSASPGGGMDHGDPRLQRPFHAQAGGSLDEVTYDFKDEGGAPVLHSREPSDRSASRGLSKTYIAEESRTTNRFWNIFVAHLFTSEDPGVSGPEDDTETPERTPARVSRVQGDSVVLEWTAFVDQDWFLTCLGTLICIYGVMAALEERNPKLRIHRWALDQAILVLFIFDISARVARHGKLLFCGRIHIVFWNFLDVLIVVLGTVDEWFMPLSDSPFIMGIFFRALRPFRSLLRLSRLLRVLTVFFSSNFDWALHGWFETFISVIISLNAAIMGLETDYPWHGWFYVEHCFLSIFVFELVVKLRKGGCHGFFCSKSDMMWNWLDFLIVGCGMMDGWGLPLVRTALGHDGDEHEGMARLMLLLRTIKLLRVLRLLKLVKSVAPLYRLAMGVLSAIQAMFWVFVLMVALVYGFSILLTRLIGQRLLFTSQSPESDFSAAQFESVPVSMFTLFRVMNGEYSNVINLFSTSSVFCAIFIMFQLISAWIMASILTGTVSNSMICEAERHALEEQKNKQEADRSSMFCQIEEFLQMLEWTELDGLYHIDNISLTSFLREPENAGRLRAIAHITALDASDMMKSLEVAGKVPVADLIECFAFASKPVTEKSVLRLEARLKRLEEKLNFLNMQSFQSRPMDQPPAQILQPRTATDVSDYGRKRRASVGGPLMGGCSVAPPLHVTHPKPAGGFQAVNSWQGDSLQALTEALQVLVKDQAAAFDNLTELLENGFSTHGEALSNRLRVSSDRLDGSTKWCASIQNSSPIMSETGDESPKQIQTPRSRIASPTQSHFGGSSKESDHKDTDRSDEGSESAAVNASPSTASW